MPQATLRNLFAAAKAIAPFALFDPLQRSLDPHSFGSPAPFVGLGHRLLLHCIHSTETPNAVLLQFHRIARIRIGRVLLRQSILAGKQGCAGFVLGHSDQSIAPQPWLSRKALALLKGFEPKNPRWEESGDGWGDLRTR